MTGKQWQEAIQGLVDANPSLRDHVRVEVDLRRGGGFLYEVRRRSPVNIVISFGRKGVDNLNDIFDRVYLYALLMRRDTLLSDAVRHYDMEA